MKEKLVLIACWIPTSFLFFLFNYSFYKIFFSELTINKNIKIKSNQYSFYSSLPNIPQGFQTNIITDDARPEILNQFFIKYQSPLSDYSGYIVDISDKYNLDFRLIPAISMQESNCCKNAPQDSYNCWGLGIYGDKITRFDSYETAIESVAKTLRTKYIDKGYLDLTEIQAKYTPRSLGSWAFAVAKFMEEMQ